MTDLIPVPQTLHGKVVAVVATLLAVVGPFVLLAVSPDALRWVNVVLAFVSLTALVRSLKARWHRLDVRIRRVGVAVSGLLTVSAYSSGEALRQEVPPGSRIALVCLSLAGIAAALLLPDDDPVA